FKTLNPSYPFQSSFVDDDFNKKFRTITLVEKLINVFAFLAIFIASLGLFGLAAFTAERRTKEFGVRKVLGASVANLVSLISRDFVRLILIAFILFTPLAWYGLNQFLQEYSYRISIDWKIFFISGALVLIVSLLIVGTQAVKAALTNPVDSLKNE
ncbi:MAG TPA: FtsX-like permease family protein, partial [Cyclobacteriaceae bacterium]